MTFDSRRSAGTLLGAELKRRSVAADIVFGLARGGVVVAAEVARILEAPLEPLVVRKIGAPGNPEFAVGAVSEIPHTGRTIVWWNEQAIRRLGIDEQRKIELAEKKKAEVLEYKRELNRREIHQNVQRSRIDLDKNSEEHIILVDDGTATGASMLAAISGVRQAFPRIIMTVALPVSSPDAAEEFRTFADDVVVLHKDPELSAVGQFYRDFPQVEWREVKTLLKSNPQTNKLTN